MILQIDFRGRHGGQYFDNPGAVDPLAPHAVAHDAHDPANGVDVDLVDVETGSVQPDLSIES